MRIQKSITLVLLLLFLTSGSVPLWAAGSEEPPAEAAGETAKEQAQDPAKAPVQGAKTSFFEVLVVTATAHEESSFDLPYVSESLGTAELETRHMVRTVPEALREVGGVMVQKTSHGQGSPYIRGFTGFRNLFLIDGIRLNTSVMREGPNQYWTTVDPLSLEELETVKGPVSVLYGSDAVGGTVQALTRRPPVASGTEIGGHLYHRWSSAEHSNVTRLELGGELGSRLSYALGASLKDFGDVKAGGDVGTQPHTGYDEQDVDFKLRFALSGDTDLVAAFQSASVDDAWRTHRTIFGVSWRGTTVGNELRRSLDQRRSLGYLQLHHRGSGRLFDAMTASLSWQRQEEERDRLRTRDRHDLQGFDVATWGAWVRFEKDTRLGFFTYGVESYRDSVDSFNWRLNTAGEVTSRSIQGPVADDATYQQWGIYLQDQIPVGKRLRWNLGLRYTRAEADARAVQDPLTGNRIAVDGDWNQVVGSVRFLLPAGPKDRWHLFGGVSQAFRAPNLSDLTRYDTARSNEIETPSPDLDPERFLSYELGVKLRGRRGDVELVAFHTVIRDMIVRTPTGRVLDGDFEVTKRNGGDGFSRGFELRGELRLSDAVSAFGTFAYVDGEVDTFPTATSPKVREPLDRLAPTTGQLGLRWRGQKTWIEALATIADKADRLSTRDEGDTDRIPPGGTPGYEVFTLRGGWEIGERWEVAAGVENLFDEEYRIHGSGLNEPGRNFLASLRIQF